MANQQSQIVYVLTNPAMPGLVKIGKTTQPEVEDRMRQLYSTGVPVPFDCAFACQVTDATKVEQAFHDGFGMTRINPNREFFKIEPERVIAILRLLAVEEITTEFEKSLESNTPAADIQSAQELKKKKPIMNFKELEIPIGSVLAFARNPSITATVVTDRKVQHDGDVCSLAAATRKVLELPDGYSLQPSPYWTFNGKTVKEIYEDFYSAGDE